MLFPNNGMEEFTINKVAITGGTGPVGAAFVKKLLKENVEILLFMRKNSSRKMFVPQDSRVHIEWLDLEQLHTYQPTEQDYDAFFHFGWAETNKVMRHNMRVQLTNVQYACDAVEIAHKLGCHTFMGAGSQAEYGRHNEPLTVETRCMPEIAYGVAKLSANYSTKIMCRQYGMRQIWPRILSAYGPYDYEDLIISQTILKALRGEKLEFTAGEQIWDFIYEDDLAEALFMIAKYGKDGTDYPIGSGQAKPLRESIEVIKDKINPNLELNFGVIPYSANQIMHLEADISQLSIDTGWKNRSAFEDGIERTIVYFRNKYNL